MTPYSYRDWLGRIDAFLSALATIALFRSGTRFSHDSSVCALDCASFLRLSVATEGIVFGFGRENSVFFEKWSLGFDSPEKDVRESFQKIPFNFSDKAGMQMAYKNYSYQKFPLPIFRCFANDPILKEYKKEQERIKKIYKGKDPLTVTLKKLCE